MQPKSEAETIPLADLFDEGAITGKTREVNSALMEHLSTLQPPSDLPGMRAAYLSGGFGLPPSPKSPKARTMTIPGPAGPIPLRILAPENAKGVYLHLHGGGWMAGANDTWDEPLELFGEIAGLISVSPDYRLAPEDLYPAAVEDGLAVALWLIENAEREFGVTWLSIGGESAGANIAAATLVRLRDLGHADRFGAANLLFGCYDLSLTPSARRSKGTAFIDRSVMEQFAGAFAGSTDLRDPGLSPLYADLKGLPPALFSVGSIDPLVDDSLFMHMRWQTAGNPSALAVYPGGTHGFNSFQSDIALKANRAMAEFLKAAREQDQA